MLYSVTPMHISALFYCPHVDGALPVHRSGRNALDLLDTDSPGTVLPGVLECVVYNLFA